MQIAPDSTSSYCTDFIGSIQTAPTDPIAPCESPETRDAIRGEEQRSQPHGGRAGFSLNPWSARGLRRPASAADGGWVAAHRDGKVLLPRTAHAPCILLDLTLEVALLGPKNALLSIALFPNFAETPFLYADYTTGMPARSGLISRLSRFPAMDGRVRRGTELVLREMAASSLHHFGGGLRFGPDGLLYLSVDDRELEEAAQDLDSLFGKILRLWTPGRPRASNPIAFRPTIRCAAGQTRGRKFTPRGKGEAIPSVRPLIRRAGTLCVGGEGSRLIEEVNQVQIGVNYGWPRLEEDQCMRPCRGWSVPIRSATIAAAMYGP